MKKNIPNAITAGNLFFGCLSIISTFDGNLTLASIFIVIAAILDFFDGFTARLLKVNSEIGKELDSMADMISFGAAPGFIFYIHSKDFLTFNQPFFHWIPMLDLLSYLPLLIIIFSAIRLATFNVDIRQTNLFIGVPTPANALFICAIPFVLEHGPAPAIELYTSAWFIILYPIISSYLLIAELPLFALKFKNYTWASNKIRYSFLACCILLLLLFNFFGISLIIVLYVLLSLVNNYTHKNNEVQSRN